VIALVIATGGDGEAFEKTDDEDRRADGKGNEFGEVIAVGGGGARFSFCNSLR
jgi:hypothetical protein